MQTLILKLVKQGILSITAFISLLYPQPAQHILPSPSPIPATQLVSPSPQAEKPISSPTPAFVPHIEKYLCVVYVYTDYYKDYVSTWEFPYAEYTESLQSCYEWAYANVSGLRYCGYAEQKGRDMIVLRLKADKRSMRLPKNYDHENEFVMKQACIQ